MIHIVGIRRLFILATVVLTAAVAYFASADIQDKTAEKPFKKCWEIEFDGKSKTVLVSGDLVILMTENGLIRAYENTTGLNLWTTELGGRVISNAVVQNGGLYLVAIQERSGGIENQVAILMSFAVGSGITNSKIEVPLSDQFSLTTTDDGIVAASSRGNIFLIESSLSKLIWRRDLNADLIQKPEIAGQFIGFIFQNSVVLLELTSGKTILTREFKTEQRSLQIYRGRWVYVGDNRGAVTKIDSLRNIDEWTFKSGGAILSIDTAADSLLISSADNFLYKINAVSGRVEWRKRISGRARAKPLINDDRFFISSFGDNFTSVAELSTGKTVNRINSEHTLTTFDTPLILDRDTILMPLDGRIVQLTQGECKK